jgi:iron complex outermembrane receptor protein
VGGKVSLIKGYNQTTQDYLVFTPANRAEIFTILEGNADSRGMKPYVKCSFQFVAKQYHVPLNSDYTAPPNAYTLLYFEAGMSIGKKHPIDLGFSIYNLLNTTYRDYLNRFRYFCDEQGRSFAIRINVPFNF